ncbi:hypothetical protein E3A20_24060 [Planctomyces bekefii]|uniref:Uncharacterized protein n=1 Tax=Planctomyces bekefii TaxID=1653850 RepID=A0A5C6M153_9PLAN|nr:hypothetical protein E3A20_24060 [Planctomyces bekefii]
MLVRLGKSAASDAEDLRMVLQQHFDEVSGSCERHGIPVTVVDYSELMADAESVVARLSEFLGGGLQTDRMAAGSVNPKIPCLYARLPVAIDVQSMGE